MTSARLAKLGGMLAVLVLLGAVSVSQALAEAKTIRIARQYGLSYLPIDIVESEGLLEKHAAQAGLDGLKLEVSQVSGTAVIDALLAGAIDVGAGGTTGLITLWDRTRGHGNVRGLVPISDSAMYLVTVDEHIRSLRDFGDNDRIAMPAVKVSINATVLQMAAEKEFGTGHWALLDSRTVALPNPDAVIALKSGQEVKTHFGTMPFTLEELKLPGARQIMSSYDVLGGPHNLIVLYNTERWIKENPNSAKAFVAALEEAMQLIATDKSRAADIFIKETRSKLPKEMILEILGRSDVIYTTTPHKTGVFADFMHHIGAIKTKPESWRDLFWDTAQTKPGS